MNYLIETERLLMREFLPDDVEQMYLLNLDPDVIRYTGDKAFTSVADAADFLSHYDAYERFGMGRLAVIRKSDEKWLGWCGLKYHPKEQEVDLGFRFFQAYWRQGYATESGKANLEYGFRQLKLKEIVAHVDEANFASIRVLEKLGFSNWMPYKFDGDEGMQATIKNPYLR